MVTLYVAAAYLTFDTSDCHSLKEKRSVIRSLIDKAKSKFTHAAFAEVGNANEIHRVSVGVSLLANDQLIVQTMLSKAVQFLEEVSYRTLLDSHAEIYAL